uniref:Uncharacterized protein n=1 Tax=Lepeophtheirus salmonis TaxID=72036 RepID=A0A0K2V0T3_LEPSM
MKGPLQHSYCTVSSLLVV